jgi:hypothetical protein
MKKRIVFLLTLLLPIVALPQTPRKPSPRLQGQAQTTDGPSLADTNAWIAEKLPLFAGYSTTSWRKVEENARADDEESDRITGVILDDGSWQFILIHERVSTFHDSGGRTTTHISFHVEHHVIFKAQDLSPDMSVSARAGCGINAKNDVHLTGDTNCFAVKLASAGKASAISIEDHSTSKLWHEGEAEPSAPEKVSREVQSTLEISFNSADTANRVANAISHAIQLARSEHPEPF